MNRPAPPSVFAQRVLRVLRRIPPGRVATYGDVAGIAGRPGAARAVGNIMRLARSRACPTIAWWRPAAGLAGTARILS